MLNRGMSEAEAAELAHVVRSSTDCEVLVEPDGAFYVVVVRARTGQWRLYDEEDWPAWQVQIAGGESESAPA